MTERIFVSGAAGVIGREIVPLLVARGATVWAADLKPLPHEFPNSVIYRQGDLNHLSEDEIARFAPTAFIHLAATFERSAETFEFWDENFWHNVRLSHHLMGLLRNCTSLERVVFASSYLIYEPSLYQFATPRSEAVALRETDPVLPRNLTGMAKLAHEVELRFLETFCSERFSSVSARIYRGYGLGSRDIISRWIRMAIAGETLTVYRPEGFFDYIFAQDTAEGLVRLLDADLSDRVLNLGTGRGRRVSEILEILRTHFPDLRTVEGKSDIPFEASSADMTRYRAATGWVPPTDLEEAIPRMIAHERAAIANPPARPRRNVLISSAARKVPLVRSVVDAARRIDPGIRVLAGDIDPDAPARHVADAFVVLPATSPENADRLKALCLAHDVGTVIPTRDGELAFWAELATDWRASGIEVVISPPETIAATLDKRAFSTLDLGRTVRPIPSLDTPDGPGRFVVKERFGAGSASIGLDLSSDEAHTHMASLAYPVVQPFVAGVESSVDGWADRNGTIKGLVLRRRDEIVDGESRVTTTYRNDKLETHLRNALGQLGLRGPFVAQILVDRDGVCHLIEVNARFGGASTASIAAGLDIWLWTLLEADGSDVSRLPFQRVAGEISQIRVPADIHVAHHDL